jgi:glucokinase
VSLAIGVDLGGTNVRLAVVDTEAGKVTKETKLKLPATDPETVTRLIAESIARLDAPAGVPLGVGVAAMLRGDTGIVENAPNLGWRGVDLRGLLGAALPGRVVELNNDVGAIAYGEFAYGAGRGAHDILCVYAGTGIGGGIVSAGKLVTGASHVAGEIGHTKVVLDDGARACNCGMKGCVEAYAGGKKIAERARAELSAGATSKAVALAGGDPQEVHAGHLDEAARGGDAYATRLWDEIAPLVGAALANAVTVLNPARVIVGGGVLWGAVALRERVLQHYRRFVNPPAGRACEIVPAQLGEDAGLLGSSSLAMRAGRD